MNAKYIAIIPARGGSKGVPKKNIKEFLGKPLIEHSINYAKESKYIEKIILTTDNEEIKAEIQLLVNKLNGQFSNPEQLKKFSILQRDFTIDDGELTPTLKIRRKEIKDNWSDVIDSMYSD